ncbi:anoctamin-5 isoform X2 [Periplaneta americana]|uniref:anoctamin-5 isoform X2 n=1 Tax=Periplaneta americana TaxID=6978 RepID=UPI0037E91B30
MRRFSRTGIHPMLGAGLAIREAFGPRVTMLNPSYERAPEHDSPFPVVEELNVSNLSNVSTIKEPTSFEDSLGGLAGVYRAEEQGALPDTETLLFRDGKRRIDMVLVYEEEDYGVMTLAEVTRREMRKVFQENLVKEGLELELEEKQMAFDQEKYFVKIHVPWKALTRYAEVMNMKMPIKRFVSLGKAWEVEEDTESKKNSILPYKFMKIFEYDHSRIAKEPSFYTATYRQDKEEQFIIKDRETFFTAAQRSQVVWQIMMRAKYDDSEKVGIRRLLNNGAYLAAFPLHEGSYKVDAPNGANLDRRLLYTEWARPSRWFKKQPLWLIKKYFGEKIGLYFAWLGFYTEMLIPASVVGLLCFFYGLLSMNSSDNIPSKEICDAEIGGKIIMCPLCDKVCDYQKLNSSCVFAKITYLFDNPATVFFAIFMSFWATTFLELWKRRQAVIVWEWDLQNVEDDEDPRPEFETSVKTFRVNPVTMEKEPYLPTWSKVWRFMATTSAVMFMMCVVLGAVLGTIIYRISVVTVIYGSGEQFLKQHAKIFTSITAAVINLVLIMILTKLYQRLALWLTNLENPRTQTEYEDSYTFKIFVFQFVNFYSSLIYIAFFKGRFFVHPGDTSARNSAFTRLKIDVCDPAGCLSELCIQLSIIMVGKQLLNNFLEILYPKMYNWWSKRLHRSNTKNLERSYTRWEEDFQLQDPGRLALFEEYLEMVLQYGFVTLFVAAFPLAPLFALMNNIGEIRLDAYKMVTQARRPLAERVQDIGAWYGILQGVTYAAVVSNAFVIAYTSDFIPRMVYKFVYSKTDDLVGYIDSSLSEFNTSDYGKDMGAVDSPEPDPPTCQYRGYRNPPGANKYDLSPQYWHVFAARLAFVVIFEHIVFALTGIMAYAIPDVPTEVRTQIQREKLLEKEAKYEHGMQGNLNDNYGEMLLAQRERSIQAAAGAARSWWGRRLSRVSDGLDTEPTRQQKAHNSSSTVWEVGTGR